MDAPCQTLDTAQSESPAETGAVQNDLRLAWVQAIEQNLTKQDYTPTHFELLSLQLFLQRDQAGIERVDLNRLARALLSAALKWKHEDIWKHAIHLLRGSSRHFPVDSSDLLKAIRIFGFEHLRSQFVMQILTS